MLKFKCLIVFLLIAVSLLAQRPAITTKQGNVVSNYTSNPGTKVTYGQTILLNVDTWLNDSLVQSTQRDNAGPREITMPDSNYFAGKMPAVYEGLLLMANGDSATVLQPVDSIMARAIPKELGEVKLIRYELKVVDVLTPEKIAARKAAEAQKMVAVKAQGIEVAALVAKTLTDYKAKKLGAKLKKTGSGLEYVILEKGTGAAIKTGDQISTSYYGVLAATGNMFDSSFNSTGAVTFEVGSLFPGFNEGMKLLQIGGKAILFIPYALAYGDEETGPIPAKSDLVFYIGLEE